ncbi:hypothetical protein OC846_001176 [Tilletia horrida]|uniref:DNA 3'-5' helicase n=1 Tax=Tilletia horrida TaxID=155126 RepID=A0AAN6GTJ9_9BASI|nr:hypothetical protein OC846_001176 [Tilletia horrida]KAK0569409.1 hypothetical protein OC861_001015 [Tilletia horrida]
MLRVKRSFKRSATNVGTSSLGLAANEVPVGAADNAGSRQNPIVIDDTESNSQEDILDVASAPAPVPATPPRSRLPFPPRPMKRARTMPSVEFSSPSKWQEIPIELKLQILDDLSLRDALAFTMAMPELRTQLRDPRWSTWRKRWHAIEVAEAAFDRYLFQKNEDAKRGQRRAAAGPAPNLTTHTQNDIGTATQANSKKSKVPVSAEETRLCKLYTEAATALDYQEPTERGLAQLLRILVKCGSNGPLSSVSRTYLLDFGRALLLGPSYSSKFENAPSCAFDHLPHAAATELISLTGTFLAIFRISCLFGQDRNGSNLRMARFIEADCTRALEHFFRLRIYLAPPGSSNRLTSEQRVFVESTIKRGQVFKIQAFAGTGKTTSLVEFAKANPHRKMLYLAFNKAAQSEAAKKFGSNVACKTFHSLAFRYKPVNSEPGNLRATDLVEDYFRDTLPKGRDKDAEKNKKLLPTTVAAYIMATLNSFMSSADMEVTADHVPWRMKDGTTLSPADIVAATKKLWNWIQAGKDPRGRPVVCPHDAYVKILQLRGPVRPDPIVISDILLVDEAQDMSHCQIEILKRTFDQWGGVVIVGDKNQKIYDFRGASDKLFDDTFIPSDRNFLLTQSFRFGERVAEVATSILRLKPIPDSVRNRTKPRLSGLKTLNDAVYWSSSNLGVPATLPADRPVVPSSLIWKADEPDRLGIDEDVATLGVAEPSSGGGDEAMQTDEELSGGSDSEIDQYDTEDSDSGGNPYGSGSASESPSRRRIPPIPISCARHTRIYRSNARLLRDAMVLALKYSQTNTTQNLFLKTAASLNKGALINLLTDAHRLFTGKRAQSTFLREYKSWEDLRQRVEAEGAAAANTQAGLVASLEGSLASPDWLDTVKSLEEQFAPREDDASIVLSTVHQAKGLEWDRVVLSDDFRPNLMSDSIRAPYFPQPYYQNEINLIYVAVSRAQKALYLSDMLVQWLALLDGYSRIEIDPRKDETDCSACSKGSAIFLRRRVRMPRQDPLTAPPAQVTEPYVYPTRCTACTASDWPARIYDDSAAAVDYRDTVAVIEQVINDDGAEIPQDTSEPANAGADEQTMAVESASGTRDDGLANQVLDLSSVQRECLWDMRLLAEKRALLAEMGCCSTALSTSD